MKISLHPHSEYRLGVGVFMFNHQQKILIAQRIDFPTGAWQVPQGGIDPGEGPLATALRELKEEIGTNHVQYIAETQEWYSYEYPSDFVVNLKMAPYKGQCQKWFAMYFQGKDEDINLHTAHPEFSQWQWIAPQEASSYAISFKKDIYEAVLKEFQPKIEKFFHHLVR